jgi:hypothetical protein
MTPGVFFNAPQTSKTSGFRRGKEAAKDTGSLFRRHACEESREIEGKKKTPGVITKGPARGRAFSA